MSDKENFHLDQLPLFEISTDGQRKDDLGPKNVLPKKIDPDKASLKGKIPMPKIYVLDGKSRAAGEKEDD